MNFENFTGKRVLIFGLGMHGGGVASANFFIRNRAKVKITDMLPKEKLKDSIEKIEGDFESLFGEHSEKDFRDSDIVIKNPAIRPNNPLLAIAKRVETDISIFLSRITNPIIAISGTKGKSSISSLIHFVLSKKGKAFLGGNITVSPLDFLDEINETNIPIILELSSFQLGDLNITHNFKNGFLTAYPFKIAILSNVLNDHLNYYLGDFEAYFRDKKSIFCKQGPNNFAILGYSEKLKELSYSLKSKTYFVSNCNVQEQNLAYICKDKIITKEDGAEHEFNVFGNFELKTPKINYVFAFLALKLHGLDEDFIISELAKYPGIEHRWELVYDGHIKVYNDSAATIPDATLEGVKNLKKVHLICGGTDKNLDFSPYKKIGEIALSITVLEGSGSEKIKEILRSNEIKFNAFENLKECIENAIKQCENGDCLLFSPSCASFEKFKNEFYRGREFKKILKEILK